MIMRKKKQLTGEELARSFGYDSLEELNAVVIEMGFFKWLNSLITYSDVPPDSEMADLLYSYSRARDELVSAMEEIGVTDVADDDDDD